MMIDLRLINVVDDQVIFSLAYLASIAVPVANSFFQRFCKSWSIWNKGATVYPVRTCRPQKSGLAQMRLGQSFSSACAAAKHMISDRCWRAPDSRATSLTCEPDSSFWLTFANSESIPARATTEVVQIFSKLGRFSFKRFTTLCAYGDTIFFALKIGNPVSLSQLRQAFRTAGNSLILRCSAWLDRPMFSANFARNINLSSSHLVFISCLLLT